MNYICKSIACFIGNIDDYIVLDQFGILVDSAT